MINYLKLLILVFVSMLFTNKVAAQIKKVIDVKGNSANKIIVKDSTAEWGVGVQLLDSSFYLRSSNRPLKIWVYLPKNYKSSKKFYPVIYTTRGAVVFNKNKEKDQWMLNKLLDSMETAGSRTALVVAIDAVENSKEFPLDQKGLADSLPLYDELVQLLTDSIKPFIDKQYRTLADRNNTLIAGAAGDADFAFYTFLKRNQSFGKTGIFSPLFNNSAFTKNLSYALANTISGKLFYYSGELEDSVSQEVGQDVMRQLGEKGEAVIYSLSDTEGSSNAIWWRKYFPYFINWALADGNNSIINIKN